jgi:hypothetical protein
LAAILQEKMELTVSMLSEFDFEEALNRLQEKLQVMKFTHLRN